MDYRKVSCLLISTMDFSHFALPVSSFTKGFVHPGISKEYFYSTE